MPAVGGEPTPTLIITCGPAGTGKTTLSEALPYAVISSDRVRKELAGMAATERAAGPIQGGIYSPAFTRRTYREVLRRAEHLLAEGKSVICDATFLRRWQRSAAERLAKRAGANFVCLDCHAKDRVVRARLSARRDGRSVSDARLPVYLAQRKSAEPPDELKEGARIRVDTSGRLGDCVKETKRELAARLRRARRR